jgi:TPR repeat protein
MRNVVLSAILCTALVPGNVGAATLRMVVQSHPSLGGKCIDVPNHQILPGMRVQMWDCNNGLAQIFSYDEASQQLTIGNLCVESWGQGHPQDLVGLGSCDNGNKQHWRVVAAGEYYQIIGVGGLCLDISSVDKENGAPLQVSPCLDTRAARQLWALLEAPPDRETGAGGGLVTDCDRMAAHPSDEQRPPGVTGVLAYAAIVIIPALKACNDAMRQYPDVARFVFQAGRVALAQKDYTGARRLFEQATSMGSKAAINGLGVLYINGWGVAKDYAQARQWLEKGAAADEPLAMVNLGRLYANGWGVSQDYGRARQWFEKAAAKGEPSAMTQTANLYFNGWGVTKDYALARQWLEKGAAVGEPGSMNGLGLLYQNGWGVPQDFTQARQWYEKAAAAGNAGAMDHLGNLYQIGRGVSQDYTQARQWYEKAAAASNADAMNHLGVFYHHGWGVTQDYAQALQWYEKGAAAGNSNAMNNLGVLYDQGLGVAKDYAQARQWFEKAATASDATAMTNLGHLYQMGRGVSQDYTQARQWYEKAAAAGNAGAMNDLGVLYDHGWGVAKDEAQARQWHQKAAAGNSAGNADLGNRAPAPQAAAQGTGPAMPDNCKQNLDQCSQKIWGHNSFPHRGHQQSITFSNGMILTCASNGPDTPRSCALK